MVIGFVVSLAAVGCRRGIEGRFGGKAGGRGRGLAMRSGALAGTDVGGVGLTVSRLGPAVVFGPAGLPAWPGGSLSVVSPVSRLLSRDIGEPPARMASAYSSRVRVSARG
jgi:hypothetical protein